MELPPNLVSASAQWLASWKVCTILLLGMAASKFLQSDSKGFINRFAVLLFISMTMLKASISTIRLSIPSSLAISRPSQRAHNSAMELLVLPWALAYPLTQFPWWLRINPPPPALPEFPKADPLELSFIQPIGGFSQATWIIFFILLHRTLALMEKKFSTFSNALRVDLFINNSRSE